MYEVTSDCDYIVIINKISKTLIEGGNWQGTTQCHGIPGSIEFLIDVYQILKNRNLLEAAHELAKILISYKVKHESYYKWSSEDPEVFSMDYMVGNAGIGGCMLRLQNPFLPRFLSRRYFGNS